MPQRTKTIDVQGGTAVPEQESSKWPLFAAGILIAVFVLTLVSKGESDEPASATGDDALAEQIAPEQAAGPQPETSGEPVGFSGPEPVSTLEADRTDALSTLEEALIQARLWSKVSTDASSKATISVVSASCADGGMQRQVDKFASSLSTLGFSKLRCLEKHGALVFERPL